MKKYFIWMLVAVTALLASCSQEDNLVADLGGEELTTITVGIPASQLATRAGSTAFDNPALSPMRVTLFICKDGKIVSILNKSDHDFQDGSTAATFEARLVKGQTYNFVAWCDFGSQYYTLSSTEDMTEEPSATMNSANVVGCDTKYDAYFGRIDQAIVQNDVINVVCRRPFALVMVKTTDWDEDAVKNAGLRPDNYTTTVNVPTSVNLFSGETSNLQDVTYATDIVAYDQDGNPKELHYDYILASSVKSQLPDFTVYYKQGDDAITDYTFQNIPVQRNYKTIITGNILTKLGTINVTIDSIWYKPNYEVTLVDVESTTDVKSALEKLHSDNPSSATLGVNVKGEADTPSGEDRPIEIPATFTDATGATPTANVAQTNINLEGGVKDGATIIIRDEYDSGNTAAINNYPGVICISAKDASASDFDIQTPNATVYLNGTKIKDATAQTGDQTFVVDATSEITGTLTVKKGNVAIYGKVNNIVRDASNEDKLTYVDIFDGGSWTNESQNTDEKIVVRHPVATIGSNSYFTIASAVDAAQAGDVINIYGTTAVIPAISKDNITLKGNGQTKVTSLGSFTGANVVLDGFNLENAIDSWSANNSTIKNCTFTGKDGIRYGYAKGTQVLIENCVFNTTVYGIHFDGDNAALLIRDCTIVGFNTFATSLASVTFDGCKFVDSDINNYYVAQTRSKTYFTNCSFSANWCNANNNQTIGIAEGTSVAEFNKCEVGTGTLLQACANSATTGLVAIDATKTVNGKYNSGQFFGSLAILEANLAPNFAAVMTAANTYSVVDEKSVPVKVGKSGYSDLSSAVAAAKAGEVKVITINKSASFTLPSDVSGLTIQAADGVTATFTIASAGNIANADKATLKGLKFVLPLGNYTGFHHSDVTFDGCSFEGLLTTYQNSTKQVFKNCSFKSSSNNYSVNAYSNCSFEGCNFTCDQGKAIYLYTESLVAGYQVDFSQCTFTNTSSKTRKPAIIVKTRASGLYTKGYTANITNCTASGFADFEAKSGDEADVFDYATDGLWGVECPYDDQTNTQTFVNVGGKQVYPEVAE